MMAHLDRMRTRCAFPHARAGACASTSGKAARAAEADALSTLGTPVKTGSQ